MSCEHDSRLSKTMRRLGIGLIALALIITAAGGLLWLVSIASSAVVYLVGVCTVAYVLGCLIDYYIV